MKGRPPKPIEQHVKEGTGRKDRHGDMLPVVVGERGVAQPSNLMTDTQLEIWEFLVVETRASRVLQSTDAPMLEELVVAIDLARQARQEIIDNGLMIDEDKYNKDGDLVGTVRKRNPAYGVWKDSVAVAKSLAEQFGLTPSARTRLGIQQVVGMSAAKQLERTIGVNPLDFLEGEVTEEHDS
jgi:P27 family predicted phage terminase small subunit